MNRELPPGLDELFFQAASLGGLDPALESSPDLSVRMTQSAGLRLSTPLIWGASGGLRDSRHWQLVCQLMKQHDVAVFGSAASMQDVPAAAVPVRFSEVFAGAAPASEEVMSADAIQVNCWEESQGRAGWPIEVPRQSLGNYIAALRVAVGATVSIGVGLPFEVCPTDVAAVVDSGADFLALVSRGRQVDMQQLVALRRSRKACRDAGRGEMPIIASMSVVSAEAVVRLLALGASVVAIDPMVSAEVSSQNESDLMGLGSGKIGAISGDQDRIIESLKQVDVVVRNTTERIVCAMHAAGVGVLSELDASCLRTSCSRIAELLDIESL